MILKKRIFSNVPFTIFVVVLYLAMIASPLSVRLSEIATPGFFSSIGQHPTFFWLPMDSVAWGNRIFTTGTAILPVFFSGMIFYQDVNSSLLSSQWIRLGRQRYFASVYSQLFVLSFGIVFTALLVNMLAVHLLFTDWRITDAVAQILPKQGTFGYPLFEISPYLFEVFYCAFIALFLALLTNFTASLQLILAKFHRYVAWIAPILLLFFISYPFELIVPLSPYNVFLIKQPIALALTEPAITWKHLVVGLGFWVVLDGILMAIGYKMQREVLE